MLSVVIPVYNEERVLDPLLERLTAVLDGLGMDAEMVFVDDGSTDATLERLLAIRAGEPRVRILALSRNFGHQAAYTAGLSHARGEWVVMMDADMQDPPELVPAMLEKARAESLDVVYGKREPVRDDSGRGLSTRLFHFAFGRLSGIPDIRDVGNFSLIGRNALDALLTMQEKNRYLPALRGFIGFRQGAIEYRRAGRAGGEPKMSASELVRLALNATFAFSELPIRVCLYLGLFGVVVCFVAFIYILASKFLGIAPFGWSSLAVSIYFLGSIQLIFLGILGEYLFRVYKETQNRPVYIVKEIYE